MEKYYQQRTYLIRAADILPQKDIKPKVENESLDSTIQTPFEIFYCIFTQVIFAMDPKSHSHYKFHHGNILDQINLPGKWAM